LKNERLIRTLNEDGQSTPGLEKIQTWWKYIPEKEQVKMNQMSPESLLEHVWMRRKLKN